MFWDIMYDKNYVSLFDFQHMTKLIFPPTFQKLQNFKLSVMYKLLYTFNLQFNILCFHNSFGNCR